jgi:hypothetical protein
MWQDGQERLVAKVEIDLVCERCRKFCRFLSPVFHVRVFSLSDAVKNENHRLSYLLPLPMSCVGNFGRRPLVSFVITSISPHPHQHFTALFPSQTENVYLALCQYWILNDWRGKSQLRNSRSPT